MKKIKARVSYPHVLYISAFLRESITRAPHDAIIVYNNSSSVGHSVAGGRSTNSYSEMGYSALITSPTPWIL